MGRPQKAVDTMVSWMSLLDRGPAQVEYIFSTHEDDPTVPQFLECLKRGREHWSNTETFIRHVTTAAHGSAANCQNAAQHSLGLLLINSSDDFEAFDRWDTALIDRLEKEAGPDWYAKRIFMAVSDGYRKDRLCTISVETRKYTEFKGEFLHAGYPGIFSDDEATYRAYRHARDGEVQLIEAKDIVFRHAHPSNDGTVPMDDTYRHQNRAEAYTAGLRLFFERNPRAATDGIRTW